MVVIDADAHVGETERPWEYMEPEFGINLQHHGRSRLPTSQTQRWLCGLKRVGDQPTDQIDHEPVKLRCSLDSCNNAGRSRKNIRSPQVRDQVGWL
jgi:hypothetical protein